MMRTAEMSLGLCRSPALASYLRRCFGVLCASSERAQPKHGGRRGAWGGGTYVPKTRPLILILSVTLAHRWGDACLQWIPNLQGCPRQGCSRGKIRGELSNTFLSLQILLSITFFVKKKILIWMFDLTKTQHSRSERVLGYQKWEDINVWIGI